MKKISFTYWVVTGLFSLIMLGSAIPDILVMPVAVQGFKELGMPAYLLPFIGVAKLLAVVAILVPGFPRLKEWAYAGCTFDLLGATYAIASSGKALENWLPMIVIIAICAASYHLYHRRRRARLALQRNLFNSQVVNSRNGKAEIANAAIAG